LPEAGVAARFGIEDANSGGAMNPEELHNIYRSEPEFWWYRGMRAITRILLDPLLAAGAARGLDAGCGTGFEALELELLYGLRMYGVDLAPLAIQYCRERNFQRSSVASVTELPFPDNCFDLVVSMDVLPVLPAGGDERALREFERVLRPGGWLFLRVPAFQALRSRHSQFIAERHRYRAGELRRKFMALGFPVVRLTYANAFLSPIAFLKFRVWENIRKSPARSGVEQIPPPWLNGILLAILKLEAALIRRGFRFAFGQSLLVVARKPASASLCGTKSESMLN
jgi:SAM-dependent methyltransferase